MNNSDEFLQLITEFQGRLFGFVLAMLGDVDQANEVLQETNLVLWRKSDEFEPGSDFKAWSFRIAHFQVMAFRQRQIRDRLVFSDEVIEQFSRDAAAQDEAYEQRIELLTPSGPVRIDASNGQIFDEAPPVALPRLAAVLPEGLAVPSEYVNAVLKSKPAHYWRFEETDGSQVDAAAGDAAAEIRGGTRLDNGGLCFPGGPKNHGVAVIAKALPSLTSNEFTLEVWVNPLFAQKRGLIGINHQAPDSISQEKLYQLQLLPAQRQTVFPGESFQFIADLWPNGEEGVVRVFSANQYRPGDWHHVVAVRRERQLEIYLNGEKAQTAPAPPLNKTPIPTTITIGRSSGPEAEKRGRDRHYFKGMVDEVALYPSALSAREVAEHYRLMQANLSEN